MTTPFSSLPQSCAQLCICILKLCDKWIIYHECLKHIHDKYKLELPGPSEKKAVQLFSLTQDLITATVLFMITDYIYRTPGQTPNWTSRYITQADNQPARNRQPRPTTSQHATDNPGRRPASAQQTTQTDNQPVRNRQPWTTTTQRATDNPVRPPPSAQPIQPRTTIWAS